MVAMLQYTDAQELVCCMSSPHRHQTCHYWPGHGPTRSGGKYVSTCSHVGLALVTSIRTV